MDIGEHPAGYRGRIYAFTNCDSVRFYKNGKFIKDFNLYYKPKNLTFSTEVYRDYEEVAGGTFAESVIYFGTTTHSLLFGYSGNADGGMQAQLDEIRFRPGVQPVSSFMRWVPKKGLMLIIR